MKLQSFLSIVLAAGMIPSVAPGVEARTGSTSSRTSSSSYSAPKSSTPSYSAPKAPTPTSNTPVVAPKAPTLGTTGTAFGGKAPVNTDAAKVASTRAAALATSAKPPSHEELKQAGAIPVKAQVLATKNPQVSQGLTNVQKTDKELDILVRDGKTNTPQYQQLVQQRTVYVNTGSSYGYVYPVYVPNRPVGYYDNIQYIPQQPAAVVQTEQPGENWIVSFVKGLFTFALICGVITLGVFGAKFLLEYFNKPKPPTHPNFR